MLEMLRAHGTATQLELEIRDNRAKVRISAAFPVAVHRSLHLNGAALHRSQAVRHRKFGVVVRMNAQRHRNRLLCPLERPPDMGSQASAVGVAQDDNIGAAFRRGAQSSERVVGVGAEPVEEVLGVIDGFASLRFQKSNRVSYELAVPLQWDLRAVVTWKSQDLPKMVTTGVDASRRDLRLESSSGWFLG